MATLLKKPTGFEGFGPSILVQQMRGRLRGIKIPVDRLDARKTLREKCPSAPGVYGWLDKNRRLAYVGKSKSLRNRLLSYFAKNPSDHKAERIRRHAEYIVWEPISHELLALIREQELIHRWRPEFNSMGQPHRIRPAFICIAGTPAPNARLARRLTGSHLHAFGPISGTKRLRAAIVSLNQVFQLRDCPDKTKFEFQDQQLLFDNAHSAKCIRHELQTCPGPCAGKCSSKSYTDLVSETVKFLTGEDTSMLAQVEAKMQRAASQQAFETAAIHRDCLENLTWLDRRLKGLRLADGAINGVLPIEARRNRTAWMILRGGRICFTTLAPDDSRPHNTLQLLRKVSRVKPQISTNLLDISLQLIVISWFRKHPATQQRLLKFDSAIQRCQQHTRQSA